MALLEIDRLQVHFRSANGVVKAVDGLSLSMAEGETLALLGESGSGKSVTANAILRLLPEPSARIAGSIRFEGRELLVQSQRAMQQIRGRRIACVFQEPTAALNPVFTIGNQLVESFRLHNRTSVEDARRRAVEMLDLVGLPNAEERLRSYPHELSGGMKQRVMIAAALICEPALLIADEPTTALDATIQKQILDLLDRIRERTGTAILFITHDIGVVSVMAHRAVVMRRGTKVEEGPTDEILRHPSHPYTQALLAAIPEFPPRPGASGPHSGQPP